MQAAENTISVYLPLATDVVVKGFTNAADIQRITIQPPSGSAVVFQGSGEQNNPIGNLHFTTPASGPDPTVVVTMEYSEDGGNTWQPSDIFSDTCSIQAYQLMVVVSEDHVDEDYNDAVCMVSWPEADLA